MPRALQSIRLHGGLGDVIMGVNGLQALLELGAPVLAPDAIIYTRSGVVDIVRKLLSESRIESLEGSRRAPSPRYAIVPHTSWSTVFRNWTYPDYYINYAERREFASFGHPEPTLMRRLQTALTYLKLGSGSNWHHDTPSYYGLKMWTPLADAWGLSEIDVMRGLYRAHRTFSERLRATATPRADIPAVAFFPSGKSFQYLPVDFIKELLARTGVGANDYVCWFASGDRWMEEYRRAGLNCRVSATDAELLAILASARVTLTCDSYVSHLAQLAARRHVELHSHDLPQHTVHPAAASTVIYEPQDCCPCWYVLRETSPTCLAGRTTCGVFVMERYRDAAAAALRVALAGA